MSRAGLDVRTVAHLPETLSQTALLMLAVAILTAARAALFAMSLERGEPTLALTVAATRSLADDERLADAIDEAQLALRDWQLEREICSNVTVNRLRHAVLELEPYRQAR